MFGLGGFVVCSTADIAKRIAFNPNRNLRVKCVTLDGDIIDPAGTLTGGFYSSNTLVLSRYDEVRRLEERLVEQKNQLSRARQDYDTYKRHLRDYQNSRTQMEAKQERVRRIDDRLKQATGVHRQRNIEHQLSDIESRSGILKTDEQSMRKKLQGLKKDLAEGSTGDTANILKQQKKHLEHDLKDKKEKLNAGKKAIGKLELLIEEKKSDMKSNKKTIEQSKEQVRKLNDKYQKLMEDLMKRKSDYQKLEQEYIRQERETLKSANRLTILKKQYDSLTRTVEEMSSQIKKAEGAIVERDREVKELSSQLQALIKDNPWLNQEKASEIVINYDANTFRYEEAVKEYNRFKSEQEILKKGVNFNVENNNQRTENYFKQLMNKQQILEKDKMTLITNISHLDEKRKQTLEKCFEQVRFNLSKIFTDLLPGAVARLKLVNQSDVTQGCELSVEFDKVKKSLNELSGGQRSLLALSFILSLLLYKPSPFYILDEIDSALDQSHTENIGFMISQRFPQSQFIIISLKQGMFSNANVLLKVSFMDGESKVERQQLKIKKH